MFTKTRVGVLRGGPSNEYEVSLKSGSNVLSNLPENYHGVDVFVDRNKVWHLRGRQAKPHEILSRLDAAINMVHGSYGEDGELSSLLEEHGVPFSGPKRLSAALCFRKHLAQRMAKEGGINVPYGILVKSEEVDSISRVSQLIYRNFPQPCVVKPAASGSSLGVSVAFSPDDIALALSHAFDLSNEVIIEEYIHGREAVVNCAENFREEKIYVFIPIEINRGDNPRFYDYASKYGNNALPHFIPGNFSASEKSGLSILGRKIFVLLGLRHFARIEFIVNPKRGIYFIEADSIPDFGKNSLYLQSLSSVGATFPQFLDHVIALALARSA